MIEAPGKIKEADRIQTVNMCESYDNMTAQTY